MRTLSTAKLLDVWDRGLSAEPLRRALLLLEAACPSESADSLARLSIGRRNALLLQLRALTFGSRLEMRTRCPYCAESLELGCTVADLMADSDLRMQEILELQHSGYCVHFRLPNSLDLEAIVDAVDVTTAHERLLSRCILSDDSPAQLPDEIRALLVARMEQSDPQADMRLAMVCPVCGRRWTAPFEIVAFFWEELNAWALRTLRDVHTLAHSYGWREADILALSPPRRQIYLELIGT